MFPSQFCWSIPFSECPNYHLLWVEKLFCNGSFSKCMCFCWTNFLFAISIWPVAGLMETHPVRTISKCQVFVPTCRPVFSLFTDNGDANQISFCFNAKKTKSTFFQVPFFFIPPWDYSPYTRFIIFPPVISCHISDSLTFPYPFLSFFFLSFFFFVIVIVFLEELTT